MPVNHGNYSTVFKDSAVLGAINANYPTTTLTVIQYFDATISFIARVDTGVYQPVYDDVIFDFNNIPGLTVGFGEFFLSPILALGVLASSPTADVLVPVRYDSNTGQVRIRETFTESLIFRMNGTIPINPVKAISQPIHIWGAK